MPKKKIAIALDADMLKRVDRLVRSSRYPNRSQAIEAAVREHVVRIEHRRLAEESAKLDPRVERALAEEGLRTDSERWPPY
jgi:metal-responsive CopG/Arc/MetJ family transcriptional regulator